MSIFSYFKHTCESPEMVQDTSHSGMNAGKRSVRNSMNVAVNTSVGSSALKAGPGRKEVL